MNNNQQQTTPNRVRIEEGKITPPSVQRPRNDNPKTNGNEK